MIILMIVQKILLWSWQARGIEFGYFNYVESDVKIIADVEQLKRVINNIVSGSEKYMDKEHGKINLRVKDVGDFVQIELEDNGKGIGAKELPQIRPVLSDRCI